MRPASDIDAEAEVLTTRQGQELLAQATAVSHPSPADLVRWRRTAAPQLVSAAVRLAACRARAVAKFSRAEVMWLEPRALEQATSEPVARHKRERFQGQRVLDLCAGIGGDSIALASVADVIAIDRDHGMLRRCRWNAGVYGVAERLEAACARAEDVAIPGRTLVHIDPDRRAQSGTRARSVRDYQPGLEFLAALTRRARGGALKLSPASDFDQELAHLGLEFELVSLAGECKEAVAWFGELKTCRRRATRLPEGVTWTDRDATANRAAPLACGTLSAWLFDPDPALLRSGLLPSFARAHELVAIAPGVDYLTGPNRVDSPFLAAFEILEVWPLDRKRLKGEVAKRRLGPLEIKVRGLEIRPESLRAELHPEGPHPATLILAGGRGRSRAILARRFGARF